MSDVRWKSNQAEDARGDAMNTREQEANGTQISGLGAIYDTGLDDASFRAWRARTPVYEGCPILEDVCIDGFQLGKITDFEAAPSAFGDAFVVAPDGSRAGLIWAVSVSPYFAQAAAFEAHRWGIWSVSFRWPMTSRDNARRNLESIVPQLKQRWQEWRRLTSGEFANPN